MLKKRKGDKNKEMSWRNLSTEGFDKINNEELTNRRGKFIYIVDLI